MTGTRELNHEVGSRAFVLFYENRSLVLFDDAVGDGKSQAGSRTDFLGRKEWVKDPPFQFYSLRQGRKEFQIVGHGGKS